MSKTDYYTRLARCSGGCIKSNGVYGSYKQNTEEIRKMEKQNKCSHESPSESGFCDDCGKFVYIVYCPNCKNECVGVVGSPCDDCGTAQEPQQLV